MTTSATHQGPELVELEERARRAWGSYRENLVDLDGIAYDHAERAEWEHLQTELREIATQRAAAACADHADGEAPAAKRPSA